MINDKFSKINDYFRDKNNQTFHKTNKNAPKNCTLYVFLRNFNYLLKLVFDG
jgi:hypothetical protein